MGEWGDALDECSLVPAQLCPSFPHVHAQLSLSLSLIHFPHKLSLRLTLFNDAPKV